MLCFGGKTRRIRVGTFRFPAYGGRMQQYREAWTAEQVKGGLAGFYRGIQGVGLTFPSAVILGPGRSPPKD